MNETGAMIQAAADGGASEVLGFVLEAQARDRESVHRMLVEGHEFEVARLQRKLDVAHRRIDAMETRIAWLFGYDDVEDLR